MVSFTHEQNIICIKTPLDGMTHEQAILCWNLFTGHVVGSLPIKRKKIMHRMMITDICQRTLTGRQRSSELRGKDKPKNKQLSIFLSQMEAFVLIIFQLFFAIRKLGILLGYSPVLAAEYLVT